MMISGIHGDWWAWKCATCGFEAKSQRTVNYQQCVAEAIVSCHIKSCESPSQNPADSHQIQQLAAQVSTLTAELEGMRRFVSGEQLGVSTGIDGEPTYGYGHLDVHGFWEFPVSEDCAAFNRRQHTLTAALRRIRDSLGKHLSDDYAEGDLLVIVKTHDIAEAVLRAASEGAP